MRDAWGYVWVREPDPTDGSVWHREQLFGSGARMSVREWAVLWPSYGPMVDAPLD